MIKSQEHQAQDQLKDKTRLFVKIVKSCCSSFFLQYFGMSKNKGEQNDFDDFEVINEFITKNGVEIWGKMIFGNKEPKLYKLQKLPVLGFLEADDLYEIFDQSNGLQWL